MGTIYTPTVRVPKETQGRQERLQSRVGCWINHYEFSKCNMNCDQGNKPYDLDTKGEKGLFPNLWIFKGMSTKVSSEWASKYDLYGRNEPPEIPSDGETESPCLPHLKQQYLSNHEMKSVQKWCTCYNWPQWEFHPMVYELLGLGKRTKT